MSNEHEGDDTSSATEPNPVDEFLAQPPFVETPGVDDAAVEREELLHPQPDSEAIADAMEVLRERHEFE